MTDVAEQMRSLIQGMREAVRSFRAGKLTLDRLVWELKSRISALQEVASEDWVEELRSAWGQLEYVNAFWIDSGRTDLNPEERNEVEGSLDEIISMLQEY
jgi:hypothetical protein